MIGLGKSTLADTKKASATLAASLEAIRLQIVRTSEARIELERRPVSKAEALARLDAWVKGLAEDAIRSFDVTRFAAATFRRPPGGSELQAIVGALAGDVGAALRQALGDLYQTSPGIAADERAKLIAQNAAALLDLELAEEAIIRNAERAGMEILRRADADPLAVLAADKDLP